MKLYIMRHGPAEDHADSGADGDRALTPAGRDRVRSVAKALLDADEEPHYIMTSPLVRCVQTAEIVAVATKLTERGGAVDVRRPLAPGGDPLKLTRDLTMHPRRRVMLVGHEPDLSTAVGSLLEQPMPVPMDKGMVVGLVLRAEGVKLRFILNPKTLSWDFDARK